MVTGKAIRTALIAVTAVLSLIAAGCSKPAPQASESTLVIGATAQPQTLDPTVNDGAAIPQVLLYNVYETLVKIDNQGEIQPLLADSYSVSTDRLIYTFKLKDGVKFATGTILDADAVVASIERMRTGSKTSPTLKKQMAVVSKAVATDPKTVTVTLSHPSNQWLYDMTQTAGIVIDPGAGDLATKPAGSGPYQLKEWRQGDSVILEDNPNYWGTKARFDSVTFRYFSDPNAENAAMLAGDLDIVSTVAAPQALDQFSDTSRYTVIEGTTNGEVVLGMNHDNSALSDLKVRQAINYAIDRQALVDTVWNGKGMLIGSMVPPTDPWYEDLSDTYPYDPAKAKQLLAESGHASGLTLRLRVPTLPYATGAAQFITSQLAQVGITVTVDELEFPSRWIDVVLTQGDYDMTIVAHVEPRDIVRWADPTYYWHYDNKEFQKLIATADKQDATQSVTTMKQAARILATDAAADFLFLLPNLVVTKADISGVPKNSTSLSFDLSTITRS